MDQDFVLTFINYSSGMVRQHEKETAWTVSVAGVQPADSVLEIGFGAGKVIDGEISSTATHRIARRI